MEKPLVLILCTGNSCRSHLAEGILRSAAGDILQVVSAGSKPAGYVHPLAIRAMEEIGIDISTHRSKNLVEFLKKEDGPTAVEYAVMLALIIVVCIAAVTTLGSNANSTFSLVGSAIKPTNGAAS